MPFPNYPEEKQNPRDFRHRGSVLALPIFPGRLQPSIVGRSELNFRVRDGNGCTLSVINTDCCVIPERKYDITTTDLKMQVFF